MFQSTHPHGVRPFEMGEYPGWDIAVSIHAPTRGATIHHERDIKEMTGFQSTHPHGVRQCAKLHIISQ